MREGLKETDGKRLFFIGTFVRYGKKTDFKGYQKTTILLKNIKNKSGKQVTDHIWFNQTMEFMQLESEIKEGTIVEFYARVKEYYKGYKGHREDVDRPLEKDYKLSHPTKIKIFGQDMELKSVHGKMIAGTINEIELRAQIKKVIYPSQQQKLFEFVVEDVTSEDA